jgi:hypothetical protein
MRIKFYFSFCLIIFTTVFSSIDSNAQIDDVKYQLRYNEVDTTYDVYFIAQTGNATNSFDRVLYNSQISIVVPTNTQIQIKDRFAPLKNNANYMGNESIMWMISSVIKSPSIKKQSDFISIIPNFEGGPYYFNNIEEGDSIKLLSFSVSLTPACLGDIRLFENNVDPSSSAPGMGGGDFSNGMGIGSTTQLYTGNVNPKNMPAPILLNIPSVTLTVGQSINLTNISPGQWVSNYPSVATVNGLVALGIAQGLATFSFIDTLNNKCGTSNFIFFNGPKVFNAGPDQAICQGVNTNLVATGPEGFWSTISIPGSVLITNPTSPTTSVENFSVPGDYYFKYGNGLNGFDTVKITVNPEPLVSLQDYVLCQLDNTKGNAIGNGSWTSSSSPVATITNDGLITAIGTGIAKFTFKSSETGCSATTNELTVQLKAIFNESEFELCIGTAAFVAPTTAIAGSWTIDDNNIVSVNNAGVFTAISAGTTTARFKTSGNFQCESTIKITVNPKPELTLDGPQNICIGGITRLVSSPISGFWISNNPTVLTVNNSGTITGVSPGTATLSFTDSETGCTSNTSIAITVLPNPTIKFVGNDTIEVGTMTSLSPNSGGTWTSSNTSVATISESIVTGQSVGKADLSFASTLGCTSSMKIIVIPSSTIYDAGPNQTICQGETITTEATGPAGTWTLVSGSGSVITNPTNPKTKITFPSPGLYKFTYGGTLVDTLSVIVNQKPNAFIVGSDSIFKGKTTSLFPTTGGIWVSSNKNIASVNNNAIVTGINPGKATFTFTDTKGCKSDSLAITIIPQFFVKGLIFIDKNESGTFESGEFTLPRFGIKVGTPNTSSDMTYFANEEGFYSIPIEEGDQKITFFATYGDWKNNEITTTVTVNSSISVFNAGFKIGAVMEDVGSALFASVLRCNDKVNFVASTVNLGNKAFDGKMVLKLDSKSALFFAAPLPTLVEPNVYEWEIRGLAPGKSFEPTLQLAVPPIVTNNDSLHFSLNVYDASNLLVDYKTYSNIIRCSFDPNDKMSWPNREGDDNFTLREETLEYVIRFQNDGNDTAFYVEVQDVLDAKLNGRSLLVKNSSHPVVAMMHGDTMKFIFQNIILPDSKTNYLKSQGYVSFSIKTDANLPEGYTIKNTGAIIFDRNVPVVTNTVKNTIVTFLPTSTNDLLGELKVYPNPVSDIINIETLTPIKSVKIFNLYGQLLIETQTSEVSLKSLVTGIYLVEVNTNEGKMTQRIVKQ